MKPGEELDGPREGEPEEEEGKWTASIVADFDHHKYVLFLYSFVSPALTLCLYFRSAVGRVEWNITGCVFLG